MRDDRRGRREPYAAKVADKGDGCRCGYGAELVHSGADQRQYLRRSDVGHDTGGRAEDGEDHRGGKAAVGLAGKGHQS